MREIKFRGYATEEMVGSQWMYGTGVHKTVYTDEYAERTGIKEEWFIYTESGWVQVEPESIGQYVDLKDKNGTEIYEGDIVNVGYYKNKPMYEEVGFYTTGSYVGLTPFQHSPDGTPSEFCEVIANTFENPNLLNKDKSDESEKLSF